MTCFVSEAKNAGHVASTSKVTWAKRPSHQVALWKQVMFRWENPSKATSPSLTANHEQVQPAHQHLQEGLDCWSKGQGAGLEGTVEWFHLLLNAP